MGWTTGGIDTGYTGGIWDEDDSAPRDDFGGGMDTAFGGSGGSGGGFNAGDWFAPAMAGISAIGGAIGRSNMAQQYMNSIPGALPNQQLEGMNLNQVGEAMKRAEQMSAELANATPNELTMRSAANAAVRGASANGVTGSLAGSMQQSSENQAYSLWDQWRRQMLLGANQQSADLAMKRQDLMEQQWQRYVAYRKQIARIAMAKRQGDMDLVGGIGGAFGALGFGIAGMDPMTGFKLGQGFGSGVAGAGAGQDPYENSSYNPSYAGQW